MVKSSVLFRCTGDSRRTHMAEGFLGVRTPAGRREAMRRVRDEIQRPVTDFAKNNGMTKGKQQRHSRIDIHPVGEVRAGSRTLARKCSRARASFRMVQANAFGADALEDS